MSNKVRFYYTEGAPLVSLILPNITENGRGPMTVEVSDCVEAIVDMEFEYIDGEVHENTEGPYHYRHVDPSTTEYEITIKLKGQKMVYWWGKRPEGA